MADFWAGVAKGFAPAYESASARRIRAEEREEIRLAREKAAALAASQWEALKAEREEAFQFKQQQALEAAGEREEARSLAGMQYETEQTRLDQKAAIDRQVREKAEQQKLEDIRGKLMLTGTPQQQEGLMGIGGVPMRGLEPGMDARTLGPTPEELQGLKRGKLVQAQMKATDLQKIKEEAEKRRLDEARTGREKMMETYQAPKLPTAPTLHARVEELVKIINNPDSTPPEKAEAQQILDKLKPAAAGSAETAWQAQERYVRTINDPEASLPDKQFAQQMLDRTGGLTFEVTDPATGITTLKVGRAAGAGAKTPEPNAMDIAQVLLGRLRKGFNEDNPQIGWIASVKHGLFDDIAGQFMIKAWADPDRIAYRQLVNEFSRKYVLALNAPDYRLSDHDAKILMPMAPGVNDSPYLFKKKLETIDRKMGILTKFRDAYKGKKNIWGMSLKEVMNARKPKGQGGIPGMNDELAAFILSEKHGLQGFADPDNPDLSGDEVTQIRERNAKAVTDFQENVRRLQESGDITDNEAFFLYRSVFKNPNR
jgi:hypothetical protein